MTIFLEEALRHAERGWPVFPCDPATKKPLVKDWPNTSSTDEVQIRAWWEQWPYAMIGCATGRRAGFFALDIDFDAEKGLDGYATLAALEERHSALPETTGSNTPRGGKHLFFRWQPGVSNSAGNLGKGLDVRGEGGYVVLPPSERSDRKKYIWQMALVGEPRVAPQWLIDMITVDAEPAKPADIRVAASVAPQAGGNSRYARAALDAECAALAAAPNGQRSHALNKASFSLHQLVAAGELDGDEAKGRLYEASVANGHVADDGEKAVRKTIASGAAAGMAKSREVPPPWERLAPPPPPPPSARSPLPVTMLGELKPVGAQDRLVRGVLGEGVLAMIYGESGSGKSFAAFDMAMHITMDRDWLGHRVSRGAVLYVAAEGSGGWPNRKAAFCKHHGIDAEQSAKLPFGFVLVAVDLGPKGEDAAAIIAAAKEVEKRTGERVKLIIIDTLNRATPGGNENDSLDMGAFIGKCDEVRRGTEATVLIVHHSGKNASLGARGHSSLRAAMDCELEVEHIDDRRVVRVRKSRDGLDGQEFGFMLTSVEVGRDEDDAPITSCVVEAAEAPAKGQKARRLPARLRAFMTSVGIAMDRHGLVVRLPNSGPQVKAVREQDVRNVYYDKRADLDSADSKGAAFRRLLQKALDEEALVSGKIHDGEAMLWLPSKA
jgi:bifunctional DNA primase/polymerase-like protein/AAA domain-containing protein